MHDLYGLLAQKKGSEGWVDRTTRSPFPLLSVVKAMETTEGHLQIFLVKEDELVLAYLSA